MELTYLEPLPILVFSNLLIVAFLLVLGRKGLKEPYTLSPWRRYLIILTAAAFCLFSFWNTDWFHYAEMYLNLIYEEGNDTSLEDVYYFIANDLTSNYVAFRAVVWGTALFLLCLLMKHITLQGDLVLCLFCMTWMIYFGYARVSLAFAMMYLGASLINKSAGGKVLLSLMLGFVLVICSSFFHKSAVYGIALIFLALMPKLLNRRTFLLLMIAYPFLVLISQLMLAQFMNTAVDPNARNTGATAGMTYLIEDGDEIGFAYRLQLTLECIPYYLLAFVGYKMNVLTDEGEDVENEEAQPLIPADIRFFGRLLFYIVVTASVFLFSLEMNTRNFYIRFLRFGFIPACIVLAWLWQSGRYPRFRKFTFLMVLAGIWYALLYSFYVAYLGAAV